MTKEWTPESEDHPDLRDHFAINEHTQPLIHSDEDLAQFLGIPLNSVDKWKHLPMAFAKWRYACADAMMKYRKVD